MFVSVCVHACVTQCRACVENGAEECVTWTHTPVFADGPTWAVLETERHTIKKIEKTIIIEILDVWRLEPRDQPPGEVGSPFSFFSYPILLPFFCFFLFLSAAIFHRPFCNCRFVSLWLSARSLVVATLVALTMKPSFFAFFFPAWPLASHCLLIRIDFSVSCRRR